MGDPQRLPQHGAVTKESVYLHAGVLGGAFCCRIRGSLRRGCMQAGPAAVEPAAPEPHAGPGTAKRPAPSNADRDPAAQKRARRMFGSLIGTLARARCVAAHRYPAHHPPCIICACAETPGSFKKLKCLCTLR